MTINFDFLFRVSRSRIEINDVATRGTLTACFLVGNEFSWHARLLSSFKDEFYRESHIYFIL